MSLVAHIFMLTFLSYMLYQVFKFFAYAQLNKDLEKEKAYHKHLFNRRRENRDMFVIRFKKIVEDRKTILDKLNSYSKLEQEDMRLRATVSKDTNMLMVTSGILNVVQKCHADINNHFFELKKVVEDFEDAFLL